MTTKEQRAEWARTAYEATQTVHPASPLATLAAGVELGRTAVPALLADLAAAEAERDAAHARGVAEGEERYVERHGSCPHKQARMRAEAACANALAERDAARAEAATLREWKESALVVLHRNLRMLRDEGYNQETLNAIRALIGDKTLAKMQDLLALQRANARLSAELKAARAALAGKGGRDGDA